MRVYIAGGIAGLNAAEVEERFNYLKDRLVDLGHKVLSPIRGKKLDVEVDQRYEPNEIMIRDLWDISNVDIVIACPSYKSIGTFMEIFFASYVRHIPVIVVATGHIANHYWCRALAAKILPTVEDAIDYLEDWYGD